MAALMKIRQVFVLTHDSIGLGEDGPTHQPIEHASSLRLIPNLDVWRPCDAVETAVAWTESLARTDGPSGLLLSRQNLPHQARDAAALAAVARGGYVLRDAAAGAPRVILIATGSEVGLAVAAQALLQQQGVPARVVSMPCTRRFDKQPADWREAVLPRGVPRLAVEAGVTDFWRKYVGLEGGVLGIDTFGESGKAEQVFEHFGLNAAGVVKAAQALL
jgi:transketolase